MRMIEEELNEIVESADMCRDGVSNCTPTLEVPTCVGSTWVQRCGASLHSQSSGRRGKLRGFVFHNT
jgi:hypothetical protein